MVTRTVLAIGIGIWTLLAWGGRVRLLTDADQGDIGNWVRIGGSLLVGGMAVAALFLAAGGAWERWALALFAVWTAGIWIRSLLTVWTGNQSMAFKLVHTVLAAGFLLLAFLGMRLTWATRF